MRREIVAAALVLRFGLELALFASAFAWGWHVRGWWLGLLATAAVIVLWSLLLSPKAALRPPWPVRAVVEGAAWALGVAALAAIGQPGLALAFAGVVLVDLAVLVGSGEWRRPGSTHALGSTPRPPARAPRRRGL